MADNYLEKKFEEHYNAPYHKAGSNKPKVRQRTAVVIGGVGGVGSAVVRSLRIAGHKVFFCDSGDAALAAAGGETALHTGADFMLLDKIYGEPLEEYLSGIAERSGSIGIVVCCPRSSRRPGLLGLTASGAVEAFEETVGALLTAARSMNRQSEEANGGDSYGRIVSIGYASDGLAASESLVHELSEELSEKGVAVSGVSIGSEMSGGVLAESISRVVRFLVDGGNGFMSGRTVRI